MSFRIRDRKECNMISGILLLDLINSHIIPYYPFFALSNPIYVSFTFYILHFFNKSITHNA